MNAVPNPLLEAALSYARRGWRVIPLHNLLADGKTCTCQDFRDSKHIGPCPSEGKHPRFKDFGKLSSTDEEKIRTWWARWPKANIGIIGGEASGIWALDTDPRNNGTESRESLIFKNGKLPYTMTARTGGGGTHEYFAWPKDLAIPAMVPLDDGLEVVAHDHIIVAAPSLHKSGRCYEWEPELGPDEQLPVEAPEWLLAIIRTKVDGAKAASAGSDQSGARAGWPEANHTQVLAGCAWIRHCAENAASLAEPEWYAQLSIVGRCVDGEKLAQEVSSPHRGYNARATAGKLRHALLDAGPATCAKVRHSLGGERFCSECPNAGRVKSPVVLGLANGETQTFFRAPETPDPVDGEAPPDPNATTPAAETAEQAIARVIAGDDLAGVMKLAPLLAAESDTDLGGFKLRLREHFAKRLSMRDLERAIKSERAGRKKRGVVIEFPAAGGNAGGNGNGGSGGGPPEEDPWQHKLLWNRSGRPCAHLANAITALRFAPEWKGTLWRDEFAECTIIRGKPPVDVSATRKGKWTNLHDIQTTEWLQRQSVDISLQIAGLAVEAVANDNKVHPPREYLKSLKWDGVFRLKAWLEVYMGATSNDPPEIADSKVTPYLHAVGEKWMISAVARIFRPGCKADCALIFEGDQGIRKSSALRVLGGEWFTDQLADMGSKDSSIQTHGAWIIEISELDSMSKAEVGTVKSFMSRPEERYRPPYAGRLVEIPRQCVFGGTVNNANYLRDESGGRRFWPVACGKIDLPGLERDRDQLWAEAVFRYHEGATWWLDVPEVVQRAEQEQADRYREDPWDSIIKRALGDKEEVTIEHLLGSNNGLDIPRGKWTQADQNRVAAILRFHGWRKVRKRLSGDREYVYRPHTIAAKLASAMQVEI